MLIDKKIKPPFMVPKDKFVNLDKEKADPNPLTKVLKPTAKTLPNRKDLNPNWDEAFWPTLNLLNDANN